jgi:hypothetical protein
VARGRSGEEREARGEARKFTKEEVAKLEEILTAAARDREAAAPEDAPPVKSVAEFLEEIRQPPTMEA